MTVLSRPDWVSPLLTLLDQQRKLYEQLQAMGERQAALVAEGDAEALLTLLGQRQSLIDGLLKLNDQLEPYRQKWPELRSQLDDATQAEVRTAIDHVRNLLDGIIDQDEQDRQTLAAHRQKVSEALGKVTRARP